MDDLQLTIETETYTMTLGVELRGLGAMIYPSRHGVRTVLRPCSMSQWR